jgi:prophage regulatory protein
LKNTTLQSPGGDASGPSRSVDAATLRQYVFDQWMRGTNVWRAPSVGLKQVAPVVGRLHAPIRYLRLVQVRAITGLATSTLYRLMKHGQFPRPVQLGPNIVGWHEQTIVEWCKTRKPRNRVTRS